MRDEDYPSREETLRLRDIVKAWNPDLWREWQVAIQDGQDVYTPRQTMSEEEAREHLIVIQAKIMTYLAREGLAADHRDAHKKMHCILALLRLEMRLNISPHHHFLIPGDE